MRNAVLMPAYEPTDEELSMLMHYVASEVKNKALSVRQQMRELVATEIQKAHLKYQTHIIKKLS